VTIAPLDRTNQRHRIVTDDTGIVWRVNKYGVITRRVDDPIFSGYVNVAFPDWPLQDAIIAHLRANDPTYRIDPS
jgi:hypothetical protein